ncbi:acyltransferase family protein, partial [Kibdelosporangium lantanae]
AARSDVRVTYSPVRGAFWTWLGDTSFALYMVHALVLIEVRQALGPDWDAPLLAELLVVVGCLAVSLVLAWLLNVLVEQPVMRWVRTRRKRPLPAHLPG